MHACSSPGSCFLISCLATGRKNPSQYLSHRLEYFPRNPDRPRPKNYRGATAPHPQIWPPRGDFQTHIRISPHTTQGTAGKKPLTGAGGPASPPRCDAGSWTHLTLTPSVQITYMNDVTLSSSSSLFNTHINSVIPLLIANKCSIACCVQA